MTENGSVTAAEQVVRDSAEAAVAGVGMGDAAPVADRMTLTNGIVLKLKPVSGLLLRRASSQVPKPEVPMWENTEAGRMEPNPNHPDYVAALNDYTEAVGMAAMNVMFIIGTAVLEVPEGFPTQESDTWLEALQFLDIAVKDNGPGRYLDWLKYVALADAEDLIALADAVARLSGLTENDVMSAVDSFRGREIRGADNVSDAADDRDGDRVHPAATGDGAGD